MSKCLPSVTACLFVALAAFAQAEEFDVLLFTKTNGFHHSSVNEGVDALRELGKLHHFGVDWQEDADVFNDEDLKQYDAVVFLLTTGDILDPQQQAALQRYIRAGNGYVGIHSASDTEKDWDWYAGMVGHLFESHPAIQTARLQVLKADFPGLEYMPHNFLWTEEWYNFGPARADDLEYLLAVDESTYDTGRDRASQFHPISWYHHYDGGRAFYTALGHMPATYRDRVFREHVFGGIYWAAMGKGLR